MPLAAVSSATCRDSRCTRVIDTAVYAHLCDFLGRAPARAYSPRSICIHRSYGIKYTRHVHESDNCHSCSTDVSINRVRSFVLARALAPFFFSFIRLSRALLFIAIIPRYTLPSRPLVLLVFSHLVATSTKRGRNFAPDQGRAFLFSASLLFSTSLHSDRRRTDVYFSSPAVIRSLSYKQSEEFESRGPSLQVSPLWTTLLKLRALS